MNGFLNEKIGGKMETFLSPKTPTEAIKRKTETNQTGVNLNFLELLELEAHVKKGLLDHSLDAQVNHRVRECTAHVKLH